MKKSDFDYDLPPSMIAQEPVARREDSRLMVYSRVSGRVEHRRFGEIGEYLGRKALLVVNDTRVIPARLIGRKALTGGRVEILLVREWEPGRWACLLKPAARMREGTEIVFDGSPMTARVRGRNPDDSFTVVFEGSDDFMAEIDRIGQMPVPPYIKRSDGEREPIANVQCSMLNGQWSKTSDQGVREEMDRQRYQTVYAARPGAVAAPTAGLHFSRDLLRELRRRGVETASLTLHVGPGTFLPVREEFVENHRMHAEYFDLGAGTAEKINRARRERSRVVIVGTTTARVLETAAGPRGEIVAMSGWTEIFIHPPYRFRIVDSLLTNFHLPCSTLLMMVAALVGREKILELYRIAIKEGYRFYSYGDAMLILGN